MTSDPMSTFLHHALAWQDKTYINIEAFEWVPGPNGQPGGKLGQRKASRSCRDLREAASFARWCDGMGWEVYVRMGSGKNPGIGKPDKRGGINYRAMGARNNACALKSFFSDVDVKAGAHQSPAEAKGAVAAMCAAVGLPLPTLAVHSGGGGFHAHWVLDQPIPVADWDMVAPCLAEACRRHGVKADHNLTVNAVCLLRIPGTSNRKYGTPRPVVLEPIAAAVSFADFKAKLAPYAVAQASPNNSGGGVVGSSHKIHVDPLIFPALAVTPLESRFTDGISQDPYTLEEIAEGCPLVKDTLVLRGKGQHEPLWFALGHVAVFSRDGVKDYHRLSDGHASYDSKATEEKFARVLESKQTTDQGWPRCQTLLNAGSTWCKGCEHLPKQKSPLNFAVRDLTRPGNTPGASPQPDVNSGGGASSAAVILPFQTPSRKMTTVEGYSDNVVTGVYSLSSTKKNVTIDEDVSSFPIWNLDYLRGADGHYAIHFDTIMAQHEPRHITLRTDQATDALSLKKCLDGGYGLPMHEKTPSLMMEFMASFKDQMRRSRDTTPQQELMGWSDLGGTNGHPTGFVYGSKRFSVTGITSFHQPEQMIREQYCPTGVIGPWLDAIRMINAEQRPEMDLLVATAFASPLMRFTGEKGVVISAFSSGTAAHKTTALKIGQAVWGSIKGIHQLNDTLNSVMESTGKTRIVPTYYDEMKSALDTKKFVEMLYQFVGGRGKSRLNRNAELRDVATWETLLVGVSNDSLFDFIAQADRSTDAGVSRIFEFEILPPKPNSPGQVTMGIAGKTLKALETNYGCAGEIYAEHLGKIAGTLQAIVTDKMAEMQGKLSAEGGERFWVAAATVLLLGAEFANGLKLTSFDVPRMEKFIVETFLKMRAARVGGDMDISKSLTLRQGLAAYINSHRRSVLATDTAGQAGRAGAMNPVNILNMTDVHSVNEYTVRYIHDTKIMRVSKPALSKYLKDNGMSPGVFIKNLLVKFNGKAMVASITSGTSRPSSPERVIELDLNHPELVDLYEV